MAWCLEGGGGVSGLELGVVVLVRIRGEAEFGGAFVGAVIEGDSDRRSRVVGLGDTFLRNAR